MARTDVVFDRAPRTFTNGNSLIVLVMVATEPLERYASLDERLLDLDQIGVILERVGGKLGDFGSAFEFPHIKLGTSEAETFTVPVNDLAAESVALSAAGLLVIASVEPSSAILSVLDSEDGSAGLEDHPYGAISNDAVEDEVVSCLEVVSELSLQDAVEEFQMSFRLQILLGFQGFK